MTQLVAKTEQTRQFEEFITSKAMQAQLALALPKHVTPVRLARLVLTECRRVPGLLQCSRESLLGAVMQAAQLGLEPGVLGQCWILPYKNVATLVVGYQGMADLAWRSQMIAGLSARAVYEGDHFVYDFGRDLIEHVPGGETDPAKLTHAWTVVHTRGGGRVWDVMTRKEIDAVRARSAASRGGPWVTDYAEMAKKTVFKRNMKLAPRSVEVRRALELDEAVERGLSQGIDFDLPQLPAGAEPELCPECKQSPCSEECSLQGAQVPA